MAGYSSITKTTGIDSKVENGSDMVVQSQLSQRYTRNESIMWGFTMRMFKSLTYLLTRMEIWLREDLPREY